MKKLILDSIGSIPEFKFVETNIPEILDDEVLIKVSSVGVCYHDLLISEGTLRRGVKDNLVLGHEFSGQVVQFGESIKDLNKNDKIVSTLTSSCGYCDDCINGNDYQCSNAEGFGHGIDGALSEYLVLKRNNIIKLPQSFDMISSSLISCPIAVSFKALKDVARIQEGQTIVIFGCGGGLGIHAAQIAKALGANVIGFTSSSDKLQKLYPFVDQLFLIEKDLDPSEVVLSLTGNKGADVVFNPVGSLFFKTSIDCLSNKGKMLILGQLDSSSVSINLAEILFREISILGSVGADINHIHKVIDMISDKKIFPIIDHIIPIERTTEAYKLLKSNVVSGRIVLTL